MRKRLVGVALVGAAFLTACDTKEDNGSFSSGSSRQERELAYLMALDDYGYPFNVSDPELMLELGYLFCDVLDEGFDFYTAALVAVEEGGLTYEAAGYYGGASISAFCPEYSYMLDF